MKKYDLLKSHFDKYVSFSFLDWEIYKSKIKDRKFEKGESITKAGEVEGYLNFVLSGVGRGYVINKEGKEYTTQFCFAGDFISSYSSFINQTPSNLFVQALTPMTLASVSKKNLDWLYGISKNGEKMGRLSAEQQYVLKEEKEIMLISLSARERYEDLINKRPDLIQAIPQKHLASYLGVTPESFSRLKKEVFG